MGSVTEQRRAFEHKYLLGVVLSWIGKPSGRSYPRGPNCLASRALILDSSGCVSEELAIKSKKHRFGLYWTYVLRRRLVRSLIVDALMRTKIVVATNVFANDRAKLPLIKDEHPIENFPTNGTNKAFRVRIHVRGIRSGCDSLNTEVFVIEVFQFSGIIVNEPSLVIEPIEHESRKLVSCVDALRPFPPPLRAFAAQAALDPRITSFDALSRLRRDQMPNLDFG